ncbi:MAG TPA: DUF1993 domain-containing protein [Polyangiaceae bacterium]|jgi:hypothetical protein
MSYFHDHVMQMKKMLNQLDGWIDKAVSHAKAKSFDSAVYFTARLAPDQYPFSRQVQAACDNAKFAAARLTGKDPPKHPDTEQTVDDLKARIRTCVAYLDTLRAADFDATEGRLIALPFLEGKVMTSADYLRESSLPNFYFHLTTAYAILRHNGVDVGKRDYIGSLSVRDR